MLTLVVAKCELCEPSPAHAQDLPDVTAQCAPEVPEGERRAVTTNDEGVVGIWFQMDVARCMVGRLAALPLYAKRVADLEERIEHDDRRIAQLREAIELSTQAETVAVGVLEEASRRAREAEEDRDAWYRSPALWAAVGAVVVIAVEVVAVILVGRLD